jgi:phenylpropionate dioxygenase-like ring-hydroxylating dioxygenase large terminal subunit
VLSGNYKMAANYFLIHENLLDLTHFNYLHRDSLKITNKVPPVYRVEGNRVLSRVEIDAAAMSAEALAAMALGDGKVKQEVDHGAFMGPAYHMASATIYGGESGDDIVGNHQVNHFMTPESPTQTHYWWHFGVPGETPGFAADHLRATLVSAFDEDGEMLSAIQDIINRDPRGRDYVELSFKGDMGGLQARRALERIMAEEEPR